MGGILAGKGASSLWYASLLKAPWTPPGWVFGFAWTTIMVCFSIYMSHLWAITANKNLLNALFTGQWLLNVSWNPTFFYYHYIFVGMVIITCLTALVGFLLVFYWRKLKTISIFLLPYFLWLLVALSLNGYILVKN